MDLTKKHFPSFDISKYCNDTIYGQNDFVVQVGVVVKQCDCNAFDLWT